VPGHATHADHEQALSSGHSDCEFAIAEMADALKGLLQYSRVATFDEADGEREVVTRAQTVLERHRPAS
jgi:hypothetical protein